MSEWSKQEQEKRIAARRAELLKERLELITQFRKAGWSIEEDDEGSEGTTCFHVTPPGAATVIVRDMGALRRLAKGAK
jgi:hypothetical protein